MQERPICFQCDEKVETNAEIVFESPCGHDGCSSAVFHPICLFDWREKRHKWAEWIQQVTQRWIQEHEGHREKDE